MFTRDFHKEHKVQIYNALYLSSLFIHYALCGKNTFDPTSLITILKDFTSFSN